MKNSVLFAAILLACMITVCSCALLQPSLDRRSGFSNYLKETERHIRNNEWKEATVSLNKATEAWRRIKPFLQVDIDHDYVNEIEADFVRLRANIETGEKPNSLSSILLIQDNWRNIGSM